MKKGNLLRDTQHIYAQNKVKVLLHAAIYTHNAVFFSSMPTCIAFHASALH